MNEAEKQFEEWYDKHTQYYEIHTVVAPHKSALMQAYLAGLAARDTLADKLERLAEKYGEDCYVYYDSVRKEWEAIVEYPEGNDFATTLALGSTPEEALTALEQKLEGGES